MNPNEGNLVILYTDKNGNTQHVVVTPNGYAEKHNIELSISFIKQQGGSRFVIVRGVDLTYFYKEKI